MNLERAATRGRLAVDQEELQRIEIRADALVKDIRQALDPYVDSVVDLDIDKAGVLIHDLGQLREKALFLKRKIKEYEEALNG